MPCYLNFFYALYFKAQRGSKIKGKVFGRTFALGFIFLEATPIYEL